MGRFGHTRAKRAKKREVLRAKGLFLDAHFVPFEEKNSMTAQDVSELYKKAGVDLPVDVIEVVAMDIGLNAIASKVKAKPLFQVLTMCQTKRIDEVANELRRNKMQFSCIYIDHSTWLEYQTNNGGIAGPNGTVIGAITLLHGEGDLRRPVYPMAAPPGNAIFVIEASDQFMTPISAYVIAERTAAAAAAAAANTAEKTEEKTHTDESKD